MGDVSTHTICRLLVISGPILTAWFSLNFQVFACHAIDNPDQSSEMDMLRSYAPDVNVETVRSMSTAFMDLRAMQDSGDLLYPCVPSPPPRPHSTFCCPHAPRPFSLISPFSLLCVLRGRSSVSFSSYYSSPLHRYSTRELVNMVRHMSAFPEDSMEKVLSNVLSFDSFDDRLLERLKQTFAAHGLI